MFAFASVFSKSLAPNLLIVWICTSLFAAFSVKSISCFVFQLLSLVCLEPFLAIPLWVIPLWATLICDRARLYFVVSLTTQQSIRDDLAIHLRIDLFALEDLEQILDMAILRLIVKANLAVGS